MAPPDHPNHHPQKFEDIVRGNISRKTISTFAKRIFVPTERLKEDHGTINLDTFQRRDMWAAERTRPPSRGGIHRHGQRGKRFGVTSRSERENWTNGGTRASGAATEDGRRKRRKEGLGIEERQEKDLGSRGDQGTFAPHCPRWRID